jgi:hypothetical protein
MTGDAALLPGRLLRRPGPPQRVEDFPGVQIDDPAGRGAGAGHAVAAPL